jgi:hypothetical protein
MEGRSAALHHVVESMTSVEDRVDLGLWLWEGIDVDHRPVPERIAHPDSQWISRKAECLLCSLSIARGVASNDDSPLSRPRLRRLGGDLQRWRRELPYSWDELIPWRICSMDEDRGVVAFQCMPASCEGGDVLIANLSFHPQWRRRLGFPAEGLWRLRLNSDWDCYTTDSDGWDGSDIVAYPGGSDGEPFHGDFVIGPLSVLIYSQRPPQ